MVGAVFPGQGSQHVGMGRFLYEEFAVARQTFEQACDVLHTDLKKLCFDGPESELVLTENTQPALVTVSVATYRVLETLAPVSTMMQTAAGHSVGEYSALVAADAMSFTDALQAVKKRGQFMQNAVPVGEGGMLAVMGLTPEQAGELCEWAQKESGLSPVEPANYNAPGQIVLSGNAELLTWLRNNFSKEVLTEPPKKVRFIPLKVSAPFHCSLMKPAETQMAEVLKQVAIKSPNFPVIQNVSAAATAQPETIRHYLTHQLAAPVRWVESVEALKAYGANKLIESGSGQVLAGLIKKIDSKSLATFNITTMEELKAVENELKQV